MGPPSRAELFGVDPRALVAVRVALALVILGDLADRAADLGAFYTDGGLVPRAAFHDLAGHPPPSLHFLGGSLAAAAGLFALAAAFAVALLAGVRPRLAALASAALAVSLRHRNPAVLSGGDLLLALLLVAASLAPLDLRGKRVVRDGAASGPMPRAPARASARGSPVPPLADAGTAVLLGQVAAVYLFAGVLKLVESPAWRDGSALALALQDVSARAPGLALRAHPDLCRALTWAALGLELVGPLLLFSPWRTGPVRTAAAIAFLALHAGIDACLSVGIFPFVSAAGMLAFLPAWLWDRLRVPAPATTEARPARGVALAAAAFGAIAIACNVGSVIPALRPPPRIARALDAAGLSQDWSMYIDLRDPSGWFEITAVRASGARAAIATEGAPPAEARRYKNRRWHAYMTTFAREGWARAWLVNGVCHRGRLENPADPIARVEIRFRCEHFCDGGGTFAVAPVEERDCP